jgi:hypothetical protein
VNSVALGYYGVSFATGTDHTAGSPRQVWSRYRIHIIRIL